jgi:DNA-3-methyladenine glycosylase
VTAPRAAAPGQALTRAFFARSVHEVASALLGCTLLVDGVGGRIVELEAYESSEPASHSFRGPTARNRTMFGPPGHVYVYRSYGIHWCMNLVCGGQVTASALLVRALEPTHGLETMRARRGLDAEQHLCSGPGRLCQALGVTRAHDGRAVDEPPFELFGAPAPVDVITGPRIGITKATELEWRYCERGSRFLSRPLSRNETAEGGLSRDRGGRRSRLVP